jgi:hypothetical protein
MNPHDPSDPKRKPPLGLLSGLRIGNSNLSPDRPMSDGWPRCQDEERRAAWHEILLATEWTKH